MIYYQSWTAAASEFQVPPVCLMGPPRLEHPAPFILRGELDLQMCWKKGRLTACAHFKVIMYSLLSRLCPISHSNNSSCVSVQ